MSIKFTNRELATLINGVACMVQIANERTGGAFPPSSGLSRHKEAMSLINELLGGSNITFGEMDALFTSLVSLLQDNHPIEVADEHEESLLNMPPSKYLH